MAEVAKILQGFIKEHSLPMLKGGRLGTTGLSASDIELMAKLPARKILLGMLVGTIAAPMSQLAGVFRQKLASIVYVLKAVEQKKSAA